MEKLIVELENCYGIKKLNTKFDFTSGRVYAIYAPNGVMKSSLAQTFKDVADDKDSKDRIFPTRPCTRKIIDENGTPLTKEDILVIRPYDEVFGHSEKTSTLLVDSALRKEYEQLHIEIDISKEQLIKALKEQSASKKSIESEVSSTFTTSEDEFFKALLRIKDEILLQNEAPFADIPYDKIFDEKVLAFLATKDFKTAISEYIKKYNELLEASTYFKKGTFNYYNAANIAKSLADNGFFSANHTVSLNGQEKTEITNEKELEALITKEKEGISNDKELKKKFADIEKQITKNANLRDFDAFLQDHDSILPHLENIDKFREDLWKSYLVVQIDAYKDLITKYQSAEKRKKEIEIEAAGQRTQWEQVIEIFNDRFFVPFKLTAKNRTAVILGQEPLLTLGFTFEDGVETASVERSELLQVLSTGEKKALYVLNIIFEIEARKKTKQRTVFVVDDIADSFDYKNKYAIVEYLNEVSEEPCFYQLILTHNFDFFRTINSRFVSYAKCLMAFKTATGVELQKAAGIKNIFVNDWKVNFSIDLKKKIASIPFIRNIIEYTKGEQDPDFEKLTSLLHWKTDSATVTTADLDAIYNGLFGGGAVSPAPNETIMNLITQEAHNCLQANEGVNFENKIVLSIAIRIAAEQFMIRKINDVNFVSAITSNQTFKLFAKFKQQFSKETASLGVIQRVILMTPESIHLNSFMYEPILDMSDEHLKRLYQAVIALP